MNFQKQLQALWEEGSITMQEKLRIIGHIILMTEWDFENQKLEIILHLTDGSSKAITIHPRQLFGSGGPGADGNSNPSNDQGNDGGVPVDALDGTIKTFADQPFDSPDMDPYPDDQELGSFSTVFQKVA